MRPASLTRFGALRAARLAADRAQSRFTGDPNPVPRPESQETGFGNRESANVRKQYDDGDGVARQSLKVVEQGRES